MKCKQKNETVLNFCQDEEKSILINIDIEQRLGSI